MEYKLFDDSSVLFDDILVFFDGLFFGTPRKKRKINKIYFQLFDGIRGTVKTKIKKNISLVSNKRFFIQNMQSIFGSIKIYTEKILILSAKKSFPILLGFLNFGSKKFNLNICLNSVGGKNYILDKNRYINALKKIRLRMKFQLFKALEKKNSLLLFTRCKVIKLENPPVKISGERNIFKYY
jgi:hypothetical protein